MSVFLMEEEKEWAVSLVAACVSASSWRSSNHNNICKERGQISITPPTMQSCMLLESWRTKGLNITWQGCKEPKLYHYYSSLLYIHPLLNVWDATSGLTARHVSVCNSYCLPSTVFLNLFWYMAQRRQNTGNEQTAKTCISQFRDVFWHSASRNAFYSKISINSFTLRALSDHAFHIHIFGFGYGVITCMLII